MGLLNKLFLCLIIVIGFELNSLTAQSVFINELMSSNSNTIYDEDGDTPDWIELINSSDSLVDLKNYSLSDDKYSPSKWIFPEVSIKPNSFILIFASDKDRKGIFLHLNFKLASSGEKIWLRDPYGHVIDSVNEISIPTDFSLGRNSTDLFQWQFFDKPTPNAENGNGYNAITEGPTVSLNAGYYNNSVSVTLAKGDNNSTIYYSIDGSDPDTNSNIYYQPIQIDTTTVLKARSFTPSLLPSKIITNTYLIGESTILPVISLSTDPKNLWDDEIGIYTDGTNGIIKFGSTEPKNYNQPWSRPANIEIFDKNNSTHFNMGIGIKIHGAYSRQFPQKSFEIFAETYFGGKSIDYKLFKNRDFTKFEAFLLRNSGQDNQSTHFRDALMHSLVESIDLENQAYQPAIVYLNGSYWGIYNIRERINKHYFAQHKSVDPDAIDVLKYDNDIVKGSSNHFDEMYNFIKNNDMSVIENYVYISTQMDINNYISYILAEMYFVNFDWYPNNMKFWRPQLSDGKWRWILVDTDWGFGLYSPIQVTGDMFVIVTDKERFPSVIFNGLIKNEFFRNLFINRFADFSNTIFHPNVVKEKILDLQNAIKNEIPGHKDKWGGTFDEWNLKVNELNYFAENRISYMQNHFINKFNLNGISSISISNNLDENLNIVINSLTNINTFPWKGKYFNEIPIKLEAIKKFGYKFVGWQINENSFSEDNPLTITPELANNIIAYYEIDSTLINKVTINEINYNSSSEYNTGDWIELINISKNLIDLSNWKFSDGDNNNLFDFPENTIIEPDSFLVVCKDTNLIKEKFPKITNLIGNFDFNISNEGELIRIFDKNFYLVDSVRYMNSEPWPAKPNGYGYTIELLDPSSDNNNYLNWNSSKNIGGTPGTKNSVLLTSIANETKINIPDEFYISQNYPNPFNASTQFNYQLPKTSFVEIIVYNSLGELISTLINRNVNAGSHFIDFNALHLSSGIYFYSFRADNFFKSKKMILLK